MVGDTRQNYYMLIEGSIPLKSTKYLPISHYNIGGYMSADKQVFISFTLFMVLLLVMELVRYN